MFTKTEPVEKSLGNIWDIGVESIRYLRAKEYVKAEMTLLKIENEIKKVITHERKVKHELLVVDDEIKKAFYEIKEIMARFR